MVDKRRRELVLDESEAEFLKYLEGLPQVAVALLELTPTQLEKSIIDANADVRESFRSTGFHDFDCQEVGDEGRVLIHVLAMRSARDATQATMALYRTKSKKNPRLSVHGMKEVFPAARAGDKFAIVQDGRNTVVVNLTATELDDEMRMQLAACFSW